MTGLMVVFTKSSIKCIKAVMKCTLFIYVAFLSSSSCTRRSLLVITILTVRRIRKHINIIRQPVNISISV